MDYKIDKGISLDNFKFQKWRHIIDAMEVGDSVFFKKIDYAKKRCFYQAMGHLGYKPVSRMDSDPLQGKGYRVWKLKKEVL